MRLILVIVLMQLCLNLLLVNGDVGTSTSYDSPYIPTRCNKYRRQEQFPEGGMFAAVSNGLWDNGAACGRRYRMRCISGLKRPCKAGTIVVEVVDLCRTNPCPATLVLSNMAFDAISRFPDTIINIEYAQI